MTRLAVDTNILIYAHLPSFDEHAQARSYLMKLLSDAASTLVVTPAILHEFVHVITDGRRFDPPIKMAEAIALARLYLRQPRVIRYELPKPESLHRHQLRIVRAVRNPCLAAQHPGTPD